MVSTFGEINNPVSKETSDKEVSSSLICSDMVIVSLNHWFEDVALILKMKFQAFNYTVDLKVQLM